MQDSLLPKFSLIIPTYNRANLLKTNLLENIIPQIDIRDDIEVIVVDDGSSDDTEQIISSIPKISYYKTLHQGVSAARNFGASLAKGEILVFIDDDCFPTDDFFIQLNLFWSEPQNKNIGILGGGIEGCSKSFFGKLCDYYDSYDIVEGPITRACTSNFSIKKEAFFKCKGFNPLITGAEDVDLSIRVKKIGYEVYFSSKVKIIHHHDKQYFIALIKRVWDWALNGEIEMVFRYPDYLLATETYFDRLYKSFLIKIKNNINSNIKVKYLLFYFCIGFIQAIVSTSRLNIEKRKKNGLKLQFFPFIFLMYLTYHAAFLKHLLSYRRRGFKYLRNKLNKSIFKPFDLLFAITSICNYACGHCFYHKELNSGKDLPFEKLVNVVRKFKKIDSLSLTGGEPFLRKDFVSIVEAFYLINKITEVNIPTNGWYTERILNTLEELLNRASLCHINLFLSFHGMEKIHDEVTHVTGSFRRTIETGKALMQSSFFKRPRFHLSSLICVHSKNINDIEELIDYVQSELPGINMDIFSVRGDIKDSDIQHLDLTQRLKLNEFYALLQKKKKTKMNFFNLRRKLFYEQLEAGYQYNLKTGRQFVPCFGGTGISKLEETGIWRPCEILEERFDLTSSDLDSKQLRKTIRNIREHKCSCTHDCYFEPALASHPWYRLKNIVQTTSTLFKAKSMYL